MRIREYSTAIVSGNDITQDLPVPDIVRLAVEDCAEVIRSSAIDRLGIYKAI